jgi:predicted enzyme related to lactoylglutathione lyase
MAHPIVHVEIPATDSQALGEFYKNIFGWNLTLDEQFNYLQFDGDGGPSGAFVQNTGPEEGGMWAGSGATSPLLYLGSDDIEGDLAKVEAAGGQVLVPKMEIPGTGWFAIFRDPSGNHVGLYTTMHSHS